MGKLQLGLLSSHTGSNIQAIVQACQNGTLDAAPRVIISNNSGSNVLAYARAEQIPHYHLSSQTHAQAADLDRTMLQILQHHEVNLVVLSGYMKKLGPLTLAHYRNRILNIHPSLLPRFGGQSMYGKRVHEAVLASGDTRTGITIHLVDAEYDQGPIVAQRELPIFPNDTASALAQRILEQEHLFYVETLRAISQGRLKLDQLS
jgi:phosphoribosylglycinamide formyltransferase-1